MVAFCNKSKSAVCMLDVTQLISHAVWYRAKGPNVERTPIKEH